MVSKGCCCSSMTILPFLFLLLLLHFLTGSAASPFLSFSFSSDHVILPQRSTTARTLLQERKSCPVNFEFLNYTIITSQCKGPSYPAKLCCSALKEVACPYLDEINDLSNDCASTMFSYINLYGRYPPGLFASECREGKLGLLCNATAPAALINANGGGWVAQNVSPLLTLMAVFPILLLQIL